MHCVLFGPPGSGKGTQADALCERFDMTHVSTGDLLRDAAQNKTEMGLKAQSYTVEGRLVPDVVVGEIVRDKIAKLHGKGIGILFDGYPRNLAQARYLDDSLAAVDSALDIAAVLEIDSEALIQRICGRRVCSICRSNYNIYSRPPRVNGKCDRCGGELTHRKDDNEETLRERLEIYERETLPMVETYYGARKNLLIRVDANGRVSDIRGSLLKGIEEKCGKRR